MILLPAIDIQGGRPVRLYQGDFATVHEVAADPFAVAQGFKACGASWVHLVDLDGARLGRRENSAIFLKIAAESGLLTELGGGIRDMETIDYYLSRGIERVVLGTAAIRQPELAKEAIARYGGRIALGIDAKDGRVMVEGWQAEGGADYLALAEEMAGWGAGALIFTDISRDGALNGPNLAQLRALKERVACPVIASGGVRGLADIEALKELGVYGAICGKSLYEGTLDLAAALALAGYGQRAGFGREPGANGGKPGVNRGR
jgi:phosphoribosylformimino-5-aminoimidazole carboxamide ribotide isomerase